MNLQGVSTLTPLSATQTNSTGATGSTSSSNSASDPETIFISLLTAELKAQDPTQPLSPDQMVSQMFSMNQLQQLISINQTLNNAFPTPTATQIPTGGH
jgi:flagellar basal-body rod modification protein FlgD